mmetsp:Transcript_110806/g.313404  ORF Transcript_110806/g.313404 Transcript_110806/m.313404 type:complete len:269 (+) Transcript_110806:77-883(+)|eukprot:CAMPEP_0168376718 /NCGR_PEP_ID=MMETSP0228-20121227/10461_1 /TAXON_ID=133427 /ORGANISM="Protoceratium reticulatum, Strain CCCM 535 (=CCMP 1889)" /LENGTH=268 /DNA_ID=CAMNT_0008389705 /DNA_START=48 /DNA_END=854 /DNA_ORIENTATION=+
MAASAVLLMAACLCTLAGALQVANSSRPQLALVQLGIGKAYSKMFQPNYAPGCNVNHWDGWEKPISQLHKELPGVDLFCYFSTTCDWLWGPAWQHYNKDFTMNREGLKNNFGGYLGHNRGELRVYTFDGAPPGLRSHADAANYIYDDPYCYTLGFLQNQGLDGSLISNYTAWLEVSRRECQKIQDEFNFSDMEVTLGYHIHHNPKISMGVQCAAGMGPAGCRPVTRREFKLHTYQKCALGDIGGEMSYCYNRACLLPGNYIGHLAECD